MVTIVKLDWKSEPHPSSWTMVRTARSQLASEEVLSLTENHKTLSISTEFSAAEKNDRNNERALVQKSGGLQKGSSLWPRK